MKEIDFERYALQNPLLGASLLWTTCLAHVTSSNPRGSMPLPLTLTVLPLLFHRATVEAIKRMHLASGLGKAMAANRTLSLGLQDRLEDHASLSLASISVGCSSSLLTMTSDGDWPNIGMASLSRTLPLPVRPTEERVRDMHKAAKRLGNWYANLGMRDVFRTLRITF